MTHSYEKAVWIKFLRKSFKLPGKLYSRRRKLLTATHQEGSNQINE